MADEDEDGERDDTEGQTDKYAGVRVKVSEARVDQ